MIFSVLVLVHEWGHFFVARKAGIKVEEFGFGYPPRVWSFKRKGTIYSINAIPFGGFVRLLGEDANDSKVLKDQSSFIAKPAWVRVLVVVAGVVMNFLLAIVLLTIGFSFGIQPLILSGQDVLQNIDNGTIHLANGVLIKAVEKGSVADLDGLKAGDLLVTLNGKNLPTALEMESLFQNKQPQKLDLQVQRDGVLQNVQISTQANQPVGFSLDKLMDLPKVFVQTVKTGSAAELAGLRRGDLILTVNDKNIYDSSDFQTIFKPGAALKIQVLRDNKVLSLAFQTSLKEDSSALFPDEKIVVYNVPANDIADKAGIKPGDLLFSIGDQTITDYPQLLKLNKQYSGKEVSYKIRRGGELLDLKITPDKDGLIGVYLAQIIADKSSEFSYYNAAYTFSVTKIDDTKYPLLVAPFKALEETGRLSVLTIEMFGNVVSSIFTKFTVPEGVAGPVGIFKLTGTFVQEGLLSLIRFMALLSLSLAIINVLPFPALDGGRLFFILIEVVTRRRVSGRVEHIIHAIGFVLLMILIIAVTYSDIFAQH